MNDTRMILEQIKQGQLRPEEGGRLLRQKKHRATTEAEAVESGRETIEGSARRETKAVVINRPGTLEDLQLQPSAVRTPGPDEILVDVRAAALNFGDLLCVSGLYPTMPAYPFTPALKSPAWWLPQVLPSPAFRLAMRSSA